MKKRNTFEVVARPEGDGREKDAALSAALRGTLKTGAAVRVPCADGVDRQTEMTRIRNRYAALARRLGVQLHSRSEDNGLILWLVQRTEE